MQENYQGAIFWIEVDKIKPNPYQPRREFNQDRLRDLADSIRQYGVLQPIAVTRKEVYSEDGSMRVEYELIAGERRWRASQLAGISVMPAVIRSGEDTDKMKLEMAIIENLQREDLNPVDRAQAFQRLISEFSLKHHEVAKKMGKSREYVSNSVRILALPMDILDALVAGKITEGHTRPILMLADRPEEQKTLFQEIVAKRLTVREAEGIARRIAYERIRKKDAFVDPQIIEMEEQLTEKLGTRVKVEKKDVGGRVMIDFFSNDDLHKILDLLAAKQASAALEAIGLEGDAPALLMNDKPQEEVIAAQEETVDADLYNIRNFSL
ncbi:MAG TPA: ParB/RepB/Spo0J family partition protein [Candidatus Paceibacterota bacterium]|nr:ParB/RepB/Spo0J family partition protein [Candidatus Paceibacterota bacterium]